MTGTLLNIASVLLGGTLGMFIGSRLPERLKQTVMAGMGLFTGALGVQMFLKTENPLIVLGSILMGALLGEWWNIEGGLFILGRSLERRFAGRSNDGSVAPATNGSGRFVRGFLTASLLFCVGPMAILGSIQDGLAGNYEILAVKSVLDGFAALAFASTLGLGVLFSTLVILVYQGGLTLLAAQVQVVVTSPMMNEMTAVGGVMLIGLAVSSLLEIKPIRVGNLLPALLTAPLIVWFLGIVG